MKAANLALKFLLELAALAAFAYWGAKTGSGAVSILLAIAAPLAMIVVWGRFAAPRSPTRLPTPQRVPLELGVFALAALALLDAGDTGGAIVLATVATVNAALLSAFDQLEA
jgi:hypothetical protein